MACSRSSRRSLTTPSSLLFGSRFDPVPVAKLSRYDVDRSLLQERIGYTLASSSAQCIHTHIRPAMSRSLASRRVLLRISSALPALSSFQQMPVHAFDVTDAYRPNKQHLEKRTPASVMPYHSDRVSGCGKRKASTICYSRQAGRPTPCCV